MNKSTDTEGDSSFDQTQNSTMDFEGVSSSFLESNNTSAENVTSGTGFQESSEHETESAVSPCARALVKSKESPERFKEDLFTSTTRNASFSSDNLRSSTQQSCESRERPSGTSSSLNPNINPIMNQETEKDMEMEVDADTEADAVVQLEHEQETRRKEEMKKEQDRLETERLQQEHSAMMKNMLDCATNELWAKIKWHIECWIRHHLNLENYMQLNQQFPITFDDCPTIAKVPLQGRSEFLKNLNSQYVHLQGNAASEIIKAITTFKTKITEQFSSYMYLPKDSLQQLLLIEHNTISNHLGDEFVRFMFHLVYCRFSQIFVQHNQLIFENERVLRENVNDKVVSFYNKEMGIYLAEGPYSPQMLTGIHEHLVLKLEDHYLDALNFSSANVNNDVLLDAKENLASILQQAFSPHFTDNEMKLKELNHKTSKIISRCKDRYVEEMEQFLSSNPVGVPECKLQSEHSRVESKMANILKAEILLQVRRNEPVELHAEVLTEYTKKYFQVVLQDNRKNQEKARGKEKIASELKLESPQTKENETTNAPLRDGHDRSSNTTVTNSKSNIPTTETHKQNKLPPLVLEFKDCSHFVMAIRIDGENKNLPNEFGESETKATVGFIHAEEKFILVKNGTTTPTNSIRRWDLCEYLTSGEYKSNMVTFNQTNKFVSFEFVLGFILRKMKHAAEKQLGNKLSAAVITIPFWLSSTQRVQMRDGAKLAGFSDVYLVNEASAAAYACLSGKLWGKPNEALVVVSANTNRVDTFVYQSSGRSTESTEVKMLAQHNSCNNAKKQQNVVMKLINKAVATIWSSTDHFESLRKSIHQCMNQVHQKARAKFQSKKVLTISGSASHEQIEILDKVSTEFGHKIEMLDAVLRGALLLSVGPERIRAVITDFMSSKVFKQRNGGHSFGAFPRNSLPAKFEVYVNQGVTHFFQKNEVDQQIRIGTLSVQNLKPNQTARFSLEVDNEEIMTCKYISCPAWALSYSRAVTGQNQQGVKLEWKWTTPTLSEERFGEIASWLDHLIPSISPEEAEIILAKKALLEKCMEMTEKIDSQVLLIKSNLIRGMVKDKIAEAQRFAEHRNTCLNDLRNQSGVLEKLYEKYSKK